MVMSKMDKIKKVAPELRELVQAHEQGTFAGGVAALNSLMIKKIEDAFCQGRSIMSGRLEHIQITEKKRCWYLSTLTICC